MDELNINANPQDIETTRQASMDFDADLTEIEADQVTDRKSPMLFRFIG